MKTKDIAEKFKEYAQSSTIIHKNEIKYLNLWD